MPHSQTADTCKSCARSLTHDEVALHKKIYNRGATEFFCIDCSAQYLNVPVSFLYQKIDDFKRMGCTLFEQQP